MLLEIEFSSSNPIRHDLLKKLQSLYHMFIPTRDSGAGGAFQNMAAATDSSSLQKKKQAARQTPTSSTLKNHWREDLHFRRCCGSG
jgi:hypothetical protein